MFRSFQIVCLLVFSLILACSSTEAQSSAVVTFTLDFPTSQPEHYSIRVSSDGPARYQSSGRLSEDDDTAESRDKGSHDGDSQSIDAHDNDSFDLDFTVASETRQKIFDLAAKAGYFQKDVGSHHKGLAFTGKKTVSYKDATRSGECIYNYSAMPAVEDLTSLMQGLSNTLEFGHRLDYDRRYQKLALDEELKRMEEMARSHELIEVTAIQPILDRIIADPAVINVTRARAQRLLEQAGAR
jgi:hypothetical protein